MSPRTNRCPSHDWQPIFRQEGMSSFAGCPASLSPELGLTATRAYSRLMVWFSRIEDPTMTRRPPPIEPDWRKVILVVAAIALVLTLALAIGALIR